MQRTFKRGVSWLFKSNKYLEDIQEDMASVKQEQADPENKKEFLKIKNT